MKGQSQKARVERLERWLCPVHGACMSQVGFLDPNTHQHTLMECARRDCSIQAIVTSVTSDGWGTLELTEEWKHLVGGQS